jgi:uncharacterized protein (DUF849 family)
VERLGKAHGTRFEFECYDVGHLYNLAHMLDRKVVEPPRWLGLALMSAGAVLTVKSLSMRGQA